MKPIAWITTPLLLFVCLPFVFAGQIKVDIVGQDQTSVHGDPLGNLGISGANGSVPKGNVNPSAGQVGSHCYRNYPGGGNHDPSDPRTRVRPA